MKEKEFKNVRWGDIYYCDLGVTNGSVQSGMRPVLVVQTNRLNESSPTVVVAAITAVKKKTAMNTHIELNTDCGLKEPSMVMLEQLRTVDKATELDNFVGRITDADKISEIKRGLKFAVGIPVKPKTERKGIVLSLCPRCRSEFQSIGSMARKEVLKMAFVNMFNDRVEQFNLREENERLAELFSDEKLQEEAQWQAYSVKEISRLFSISEEEALKLMNCGL